MNEYDELVLSEVGGLSDKIVTVLKQENAFGPRGVATMMMTCAGMLQIMADTKNDVEDARTVTKCLNLIAARPAAMRLLLGQMGRTLAMMNMGMYDNAGGDRRGR